MGSPAVGDVVLLSFPFSDLSHSKLRPALVVGLAERTELIVCQITSRPYSSSKAIEILPEDFESGSLDRVSYARADKIFTANPSILKGTVGRLSANKASEIRRAVVALFE
jgi:mRNA interferase MazF